MRAVRRGVLIGTLAIGVFASTAAATVFHSSSGQFYGVALRHGVSAAALAGFRVPAPSGTLGLKSNGNMDYNGGPVLHSSSPYLIFWDPSGKIPASSRAVMSKYQADVAKDSGKSTNVYSVLRQYTDTTGFANYSQRWTSSQAIVDTQKFPANGCSETGTGFPVCLSDAQVRTELTRLIAVKHLPRGLGAPAPMYAFILPPNVNECFGTTGSSGCSDNAFCAYHTNLVDGGQEVVYSIDPFIVWTLSPTKGCQTDGTAKYQSPNTPADHGYQISDNLSHENSETITDPLGTAWWNTYMNNGEEVGDNCATYGSPSQPLMGLSVFAYGPPLGGSASAGNLFDQIINAHKYYNQTEWSNGDVNCKTMNTAAKLVAEFATSGTLHHGSSISFLPTGSSSSRGYSSTTWTFGDGKSLFSRSKPVPVKHVFAKAGTYTVTLTLVDTVGNAKSFAKTLKIT